MLGRLSMTSGGDTKSGPEDKPFEFLQPYSVRPEQFAVFPCTRRTGFDDMYAACVLVIAGGKRLVFGAPLGQDWRGIGRVDGVFLPNGHSRKLIHAKISTLKVDGCMVNKYTSFQSQNFSK